LKNEFRRKKDFHKIGIEKWLLRTGIWFGGRALA
jgi:hypothetical protein